MDRKNRQNGGNSTFSRHFSSAWNKHKTATTGKMGPQSGRWPIPEQNSEKRSIFNHDNRLQIPSSYNLYLGWALGTTTSPYLPVKSGCWVLYFYWERKKEHSSRNDLPQISACCDLQILWEPAAKHCFKVELEHFSFTLCPIVWHRIATEWLLTHIAMCSHQGDNINTDENGGDSTLKSDAAIPTETGIF